MSAVMNEAKHCRSCGVELPEGATGEQCDQCETLEGLLLPDLAAAASDDSVPASTGSGEETGDEFGDYVLLKEIARGGMGRVHRARQKSLNRIVALKRPLPDAPADADRVRRFRTEAEAVATLSHPNIIPVFESGEHEGEPFFSMAYVEGEPLSDLLRRQVVSISDAVAWVRKIAGAIHHAHQRGVLHRDLKPANIIIDAKGEPLVADFGIACLIEGGERESFGTTVGTPTYMAPEQIGSDGRTLSVATDVYALGGILYHLVTGRPPFTGETKDQVLWSAYYEEPIPPATVNPRVPADLEAICLKALQKVPEQRYESALSLAEDLLRFEHGRPVQARPVSMPVRFWMWVRRNPLVSSLLATLVITAASFMVMQLNSIHQVRSARADSEGIIGFLNQDLARDLRDVGRLDLMEKIIRRAEDYYTNHTALGDHGYMERKAFFFENAASVRKELGDLAQAEAQAAKAEEIFESQHAQDPTDAHWKRYQSRTRLLRMNIAKEAGQRSTAEAHGQAATSLAATALSMSPGDPTNRAHLANVLLEQGSLWIEEKRSEGASTNIARAQSLLHEATGSGKPDPDWFLMLANCAYYRGLVAQLRKEPEGALQEFGDYLGAVQKLTVRYPRNSRWQFELAVANARVAEAFTGLREFSSAQPYLDVFEDLSRRLTQSDPRNKMWLSLHARSLAWQGFAARSTPGTQRDARPYLQSALIIQSNLVQNNPDWDRWSEDVAETTKLLAQLHVRQGNDALARSLIAGWRSQCEQLALANPQHVGHQLRWGSAIASESREVGINEGIERQIVYLRDTVKRLSTLGREKPVALVKARVLAQIGDALQRNRDLTGAATAFQEALQLRLEHAQSAPLSVKVRDAIPNNFLWAAKTHLQAGNAAQAVQLAEQGVEWGARHLALEENRRDYADLCSAIVQADYKDDNNLQKRVAQVLRRTLAERLSEPPTLTPQERDAVEEASQWLSQHP